MIKKIIQSATFRQSGVTTAGTVINGGLGALFYILLARFLGPDDFGLLTLSITSLTLISDIADLGTNTGLVRFVSSHLQSDKEKAFQFLKLSLEIKVLASLIILVIGFIASPILAESVFNKPEMVLPLRLSMVGVVGSLVFSYATSALQAIQKFTFWSVVNISSNALRLAVVALLAIYSQLNLTSSLVSYIIFPFVGFFIASFILPTRQILSVKGELEVSRSFFKYNAWVALFTVFAAVSARLDTFITARLLSTRELGIYGAANQLITIVPQVVSALGVVGAPKFASYTSNTQMLDYFKKFQGLVTGLVIFGLILIPIADYLIPIILGGAYLEVVPIFNILCVAMLIFLFSVPTHNSVFYYFAKPEVFVWVALGHLLLIGLLGYYLTSQFGLYGASLSVLIGMIFNLVSPLGWMVYKIRR